MIEVLHLPRWDMTPYFPDLGSKDLTLATEELKLSVETLTGSIESCAQLPANSDQVARALEQVLADYNSAAEKMRLISTYIRCFVNTDSTDELALSKDSELDPIRVSMQAARSKFVEIVGRFDLEPLLAQSHILKDHEFALQKAKAIAIHQMPESEELLAGKLRPTGSQAWERLYGNFTSNLMGDVIVRGEKQNLPMSSIRALAFDPIESTRQAAYTTELKVWKENRIPVAAALNSIKGEHLLLSTQRSWNSPLDESLFNANIDRETLEAMQDAIKESLPNWRSYLKAKAKRLGNNNGLPWFNLFAPIGESIRDAWTYKLGSDFIYEAFAQYDDDLVQYAKLAIDKNWVDAEPRKGKTDGAYCAGTIGGESRILMNFKPSFRSVSTLAHELGHGYHNWLLQHRSMAQRQTPMTLAETASIFCETLLFQHGLSSGTDEEKLPILESWLVGSCQVVVDIHSRFLFEEEVYNRREKRELSPEEFCKVMQDAQIKAYGDGLDADYLHPYMWAAKSHYYSGLSSFYNYPYTFGLLFGIGLYAIFQAEPNGFSERYKKLLSSTGMGDANQCAKEFGINIRSSDFWRESLRVLNGSIEKFVEIANKE